jgi:hypothetical protein
MAVLFLYLGKRKKCCEVDSDCEDWESVFQEARFG